MPKSAPPITQEQRRLDLERELERYLQQEARAKEDLAFAEARILRIRRQLLEAQGAPASILHALEANR